MKKKKIGLLLQIVIAIAAGILAGMIPSWFSVTDPAINIVVRLTNTFKDIFGQLLGFMIPLIIAGLVIPAIANIGNKAGKLLIVTVLIAYISTVFAGVTSYLTGAAVFPDMISPSSMNQTTEAVSPAPFFTMQIPPIMGVMSALVLAFTVGLGLAYTQNEPLMNVSKGFEQLMTLTIEKVIIPALPFYIFCIFLDMSYVGEVFSILSVFIKIIGVIFIIHIGILILQFCIAGAIAKKNPFKLLLNMMPAYFTALGTQSSAATIPITLAQTRKNGVSDEISGFTVPLCATIHMSGSTLKIVACALAIMIMNGMDYSLGMFIGFVCMLAITMVAAPGVPGGAIMASLGLLGSMLGFDQEAQALMIALYIAMDSFGTACNVTGDGAIAVIVDKLFSSRHK